MNMGLCMETRGIICPSLEDVKRVITHQLINTAQTRINPDWVKKTLASVEALRHQKKPI